MKKIEMTKHLLGANGWTTDGTTTFYRVSRWITVKQNYNATKRNTLWYYVTDENGHQADTEKFDPENGTYLDYFTYDGKNYALNQFGALMNPFWHPFGYSYEDESGNAHYLSGFDVENYYNPLFIELDEYGERVRVYREA